MGSSTRRIKFGQSFEKGLGQLQDARYEDAMESFVHAHQLALKLLDSTGAYISCDYLLSSIVSCVGTGEEEEERLYSILVGFLRHAAYDEGGNDVEEDEAAWAAYFVGRSLLLRDGGEDMDRQAAHWLQKCRRLASTNYLKYEVCMHFGQMLVSQEPFSEALQDLYKSAIEAAKLLDRSILEVSARYLYFASFLLETEEAHRQLSVLKSLADPSDDPFIKGVSARAEGHFCFRLRRYYESKTANEAAISLLEHLPTDWVKHLEGYSLSEGDPTGSFPCITIRITAEILRSAWYEIGSIERLIGDLGLAEEAFLRALQYCSTVFDQPDALLQLSSVCFDQGSLQKADKYLDTLLEISGDSREAAQALVLRAGMTYNLHHRNLTEEVLLQVQGLLDKAEKMGRKHNCLPGSLVLMQFWQGFLLGRMLRREEAIEKFVQCLDGFWEEEGKLGPSNNEGRIAFLENSKLLFRYLQIYLVTSEPEQVKRAIIWAEKERARDLICEMKGYALDVDTGPVSFDSKDEDMAWEEIESIVRLAGKDSVFLLFTQLQDNMAITYLLHDGDEPKCNVSIFRVNDTTNEFVSAPIFSKVEQVKNQICSATYSCQAQQEWLKYFHMLLIEPWKADLERIQPSKIILVPTEELSLLPFAALRDSSREDDEDPYLIQQYALVYAPSLQVFKQCWSRWESLKSRQPSHEQMALVVGNPTLTDEPELESLASAQKEAVDVAQRLRQDAHFRDVKLLQENDATIESVRGSITSYSWVHMACHAIVDPEFPNGALLLGSQSSAGGAVQPRFASVRNLRPSSNLLVPASRASDSVMMPAEGAALFRGMTNRNLHHGNISIPDAVNCDKPEVERALQTFLQRTVQHYAGRLTGDDIGKNLQASGVVLSACSTGLGRICAEGILGLSRSLHVAGVPATLVSLWKVKDKATLDFMQLLYSELSGGVELALAVQSTMKSMIEAEDDFGNPEYAVENWAAFIVSGSPFVKLVY